MSKMHHLRILILLAVGALLLPAVAQEASDPAALRRLEQQAIGVFDSLSPAVAKASRSTVGVLVGRQSAGFGTVVAEETVLTKWSEIRDGTHQLRCRSGEGPWLKATLKGLYRDDDLAVLKVEGLKAPPVTWAAGEGLRLGQFLALARPDGEAGAMGVLSVLPRSLRESDRGYLGIEMDLGYEGPGVRIGAVRRGTSALKAGLRQGDVITGLKGRAVGGSFELSSVLQQLKPGENVRLKYRRGEEQRAANIVLGERPEEEAMPWDRIERMNNMGGHQYSDVRDDFRNVIQSDMQIDPDDCGAPVVGLDGRAVGIAVARAGRIKSFIIDARAVQALLAKDPEQPGVEEVAGRARPVDEELTLEEDPFEVMRRHMRNMQRLMREIDESEQ